MSSFSHSPAPLSAEQCHVSGNDAIVSLSWTPSADAPGLRYELRSRRADTEEWTEPLLLDTPELQLGGLTEGTYKWQLRVVDDTGNKSEWTTMSFISSGSRKQTMQSPLLQSGVVLILNDCELGSCLRVSDSRIHLLGRASFSGQEIFRLVDFSGVTSDLFFSCPYGLNEAAYIHQESPHIGIEGTLYSATLSSTPEGYANDYRTKGSVTIAAGHVVQLEDGARLTTTDTLTILGALNVNFTQAATALTPSHIIICDRGRLVLGNAGISGGSIDVQKGGTLTLQNSSTGADIWVEQGADVTLHDSSFSSLHLSHTEVTLRGTLAALSSTPLVLTDFSGKTADLWENCTFSGTWGSDAGILLCNTLQDATLSAPPSGLPNTYITQASLSIAAEKQTLLAQGCMLRLGGNLDVLGRMEAQSATISSKKQLHVLRGGSALLNDTKVATNNLRVDAGASFIMIGGELSAALSAAPGSALSFYSLSFSQALSFEKNTGAHFNNCSFSSGLTLRDDTTMLLGTSRFSHGSKLVLESFTGSTANIWSNATVDAKNATCVMLAGKLYNAILSATPTGLDRGYCTASAGYYDSGLTIVRGNTVVLQSGAVLNLGSNLKINGTLKAESAAGGVVIISNAEYKSSLIISEGGCLDLNHAGISLEGANSELQIENGGVLRMQGGSFYCRQDINIKNGAIIELENTAVNSSLTITSGIGHALKNCQFANGLWLSTSRVELGESITFTGENAFFLYNFQGNTRELWEGLDVTAPEGACVHLRGNIKNATLTAPPAGLSGGYRGGYNLSMEGCSIESTIQISRQMSMLNCSVNGTLEFEATGSESTITGCDLSRAIIHLPEDESFTLNLSGNYWGTNDIDAIKERIIGYDESRVNLGERLTASPYAPEDNDFFFRLNQPQLVLGEDGSLQVILSWNCDEDVTCTIKNGSWVLYSGKDKSFSHAPSDSYYSSVTYTIIATDASGNTKEVESSVDFSIRNASLTFRTSFYRQYEGVSEVSFQAYYSNPLTTWEHFSLMVDGEMIVEDSSNSQGAFLIEDGKHEYTAIYTNESGNKLIQNGTFYTDTKAPCLRVETPHTQEAEAGAISVSFRWEGEQDATYSLWVDGELHYHGQETSTQLILGAGGHSYRLTATDAGGNTTEHEGVFSPPMATTPAPLRFDDTVITRRGADLADVSFSWSCKTECEYTLYVNDIIAYRGTQPGCTLELQNGRYSYRLEATHADGTLQQQEGSLCVGGIAPLLSLNAPVYTKAKKGQIRTTLSWSGEKGANYRVLVDGKEVYTGNRTKCSLLLEDGEHSYSVTATNKQGVETTCHGSFSADTTPPELLLREPQLTKVAEGQTQVSFQWFGEDDSTFTLKVDKQTYTPLDNSHTLILSDGKHSYSLIAVDSAGNKEERKGTIVLDATSPKYFDEYEIWKCGFSNRTLFRVGENGYLSLLKWKKESGVTYRVSIGDEIIYEGTNNSCKTILERGDTSVTLTATDAAGNSSSLTAHAYIYPSARIVMGQPRIITADDYTSSEKNVGKVAFDWTSPPLSCKSTFILDGKKANYWAVNLKEGAHSYTLDTYNYNLPSDSVQGHLVWDGSASRIHLLLEDLSKAAEGKVKVEFKWDGITDSSFRLSVDGAEIYTGTGRELTHIMADGTHSYSLTAFHADGSTDTVGGTFSFDASGPAIALKGDGPVLKRSKEGVTTATFSWIAAEKANFYVEVDDDIIYSGSGKSCKATLADGEHRYRIVGADSDGNCTEISGSFTTDGSLPVLNMMKPGLTELKEKGKHAVTLTWVANEQVSSYTLTIGGRTYKNLTGNSITVELKDGNHSYTLTGRDLAGNSATLKGKVDTLAPKLTLSKPTLKKTGEGEISARLRWSGEKGAGYLLSVDGGEAFSVEGTSYTLTGLRDGYHYYSVTAIDAAGNTTTSASDARHSDFSLDATAPDLILLKPDAATPVRGKVKLSWSIPDTESGGIKYTVKVNGNNASWNNRTKLWSIDLKPGTHNWTITAKDAKGNTITRESTLVLSQEGILSWDGGSVNEATSGRLIWNEGDASDIRGRVSDATPVNNYIFEVDGDATLALRLDALAAPAQLNLLWLDDEGNTLRQYACTAQAHGLDREMELSSGRYCLQVESSNGLSILSNTNYELSLALEQDGTTRHAVLAAPA